MPLWTPPQLDIIKPTIEIRERFERRIDRDFSESRPDNRSDLLSRLRIGATTNVRGWKVEAQYQYAHGAAWTRARNFSTENSDLSLLYTEGRVDSGTLTIGRQKIAIADQRLIGPSEWANAPRSFDGGRLRAGNWDLWGFRIGVASPRPRHARVAGAGYRSRFGESYLIYKHDKSSGGDVDIATIDHVLKRALGGFDFEFEGALQGGRNAGRDHRAWAFHSAVSKKMPHGLSPFIEVNAASGGSNPARSLTFDNLYPTNHNKYGIADMQSWRNMNELVLGLNWRPRPGGSIHLSYHLLALRDEADAWYGAGGGPNRGRFGILRDPTGMAGRDVGQELDLDSTWTLSPTASLQAGFALFKPGRFVRTLNGGDARDQVWFYVQLGSRF